MSNTNENVKPDPTRWWSLLLPLPWWGWVLVALGVSLEILLLATVWPFAVLGAYGGYRLIRYLLMRRYFASEEFIARKEEIQSVVAEHNDVKQYVSEIRNSGTFELGESSTGSQAHLAESTNTSRHNYKRDRHVADFAAPNVHNCSLQVVRNAQSDPVKYLIKYFDIRTTETGLAEVEKLGESVSRLEEAVTNLKAREQSITDSLNPPRFIVKHYNDEFMEQVGVELSPISVPYPKYVFEYVSAGGNSGQKTEIKLDTPAIDALVSRLSEKIKFAKSAAGQRALMTGKLRNHIKERDDHTCQFCSVSLRDQEHLLLEVDHKIPVSKGGLSVEENLQTLCWRCNRSKSNKIL
jgi:plasmid maintenance system killer protein